MRLNIEVLKFQFHKVRLKEGASLERANILRCFNSIRYD